MIYRIVSIFCIVVSTIVFAQGRPIIAQDSTKTQTQKEQPSIAETYDGQYPYDLSSINLRLPLTVDTELQRVLRDKKTVFYKLPSVWQHYVPPSRIEQKNLTLGTVSYKTNQLVWGLYYTEFNPDAHANFNFPWDTTVGLNSIRKETNVFRTMNFMNLPKDDSGEVIPVLVIGDYPVKWIFPAGTTFGEIIYIVYNKERYVQEIRTRKKSSDSSEWEPFLYRPVANREEYIRLSGEGNYVPAKNYMFFRNPQEDEVFKMEGFVERLPPLSESKVKEILSRPFKDVTLENWSPSSDQEFHILPKNYCFSLLDSVDSYTCANCHRQTQISVRSLVPKDPSVINDPIGTGNIRGSDGIFTWHPFSYFSVRRSDKEPEPTLKLRKYDLENKLVKILNHDTASKEDLSKYKLTLYVEEALKPYELPSVKTLLHAKGDNSRYPLTTPKPSEVLPAANKER